MQTLASGNIKSKGLCSLHYLFQELVLLISWGLMYTLKPAVGGSS